MSDITVLKSFSVWDRTTRWFHWINFLCVLSLIIIGVLILNSKALYISFTGKFNLKVIHVTIGYVLISNLLWRIIWGFIGGYYSRWRQFSPFNFAFWSSLKQYISGFLSKKGAPSYKGHNPLGKIIIIAMFAALITQATTGLVLAGTDIYYPPFGNNIKAWITGDKPNLDVSELTAYNINKHIDLKLFADMKKFRRTYVNIHLYSFYTLSVLILIHIFGVIVTEIREKNGIISAMFTGKKVFPHDKDPVD